MDTSSKSNLHSASLIAIRDCVGLQPGERTLIITDEPLRSIGYALWKAAKELGSETVLVEILPRKSNGEEPPAEIAEMMTKYDVVLCPTSRSLTHTNARRTACANGARVATLPGVTEEIMIRCMGADYLRIAERTGKLVERMSSISTIRVTSPAGTDIVMPMKGRRAIASTGMIRNRGDWGNLPTGEAYLAPLEGLSNGIVVVDGSMATVGLVKEPIRITVKDGYATTIEGGAEAKRLTELLEPHGLDGRNVAEFGIGTNDRAILTGVILEDEKVMGTIHIAFGDNKSMGGNVKVSSHLDGLIKDPTVWFDDECIMKDGTFTITV